MPQSCHRVVAKLWQSWLQNLSQSLSQNCREICTSLCHFLAKNPLGKTPFEFSVLPIILPLREEGRQESVGKTFFWASAGKGPIQRKFGPFPKIDQFAQFWSSGRTPTGRGRASTGQAQLNFCCFRGKSVGESAKFPPFGRNPNFHFSGKSVGKSTKFPFFARKSAGDSAKSHNLDNSEANSAEESARFDDDWIDPAVEFVLHLLEGFGRLRQGKVCSRACSPAW